VPQQGGGAAGGGARRPAHDRGPAAMIERDVVVAEGPDAEAFLQGQLSQDVAGLAVGESALSFLLQPQGKVDALVRVQREADDRFAIDVDRGWGQAVVERLNRFRLRVKCEIGMRGVEQMAPPWGDGDRLDAVWPAMGKELDESTIPAETGLVDRAVSFAKGCYTGQELVARIDSRGGHVPRHLRRLELGSEGVPEGAVVVVDGKVRGTLTSVVGAVALAYVHREVSPPATVAVRWEGGSTTAVVA
jgi:folate-binding protein YgfZ